MLQFDWDVQINLKLKEFESNADCEILLAFPSPDFNVMGEKRVKNLGV